jgi:LytS/YehU family sensor histidine kinase
MMIQPFVENAIIHGIKKKEGKGQLKIEFKTTDNTLVCEITDDGIGRKKSAEIKAKTPAKHKSTGIKVTEKRLEQLQIQSGMEAGFEIVDLYTNDIPCGTKVIVRIPFEAGPMHLNLVN